MKNKIGRSENWSSVKSRSDCRVHSAEPACYVSDMRQVSAGLLHHHQELLYNIIRFTNKDQIGASSSSRHQDNYLGLIPQNKVDSFKGIRIGNGLGIKQRKYEERLVACKKY